MPKLEIDIGNSFAKWRITPLGISGRVVSAALSDVAGFPAEWCGVEVTAIWLGSVLGDLHTEAAINALQKRFDCEIHRAYSSNEAAGVINGYAEPKRLGVDRWLALLAARQCVQGDVIVVDAGTAITLDLLTGQGRHLGGYILPGVARQAESLLGATGRVQVDLVQLQPLFNPGYNTQDCVAAAITASVAGLCAAAQQLLPNAVWCLTGGDMNWLKAICDERCVTAITHPDLVLDGLAWCRMQTYSAP